MADFNWTQLLPDQAIRETVGVTDASIDLIPIYTSVSVGFFICLFAVAARMAIGTGERAIAPADRLSIKGFVEMIIESISGLSEMVLGDKGRAFVPMFTTIFIYIWFQNLSGLLPGMTPATDNINTAVALGLFSFGVYNFYGFKEHGISYLKQFLGPVIWMAPLMLIIELISHVVRPLSLGLRLSGNMSADHTVLGIFLELVPIGVPAIFYVLGVFVCSMQAFVFTVLSMIYVSMATSHDH